MLYKMRAILNSLFQKLCFLITEAVTHFSSAHSFCTLSKTLLKGIDHPKIQMNCVIIYSQSSCSKPAWDSFFCWTQKKIFWRMVVTKKLPVAIDFHSIFLYIKKKKKSYSIFKNWVQWGYTILHTLQALNIKRIFFFLKCKIGYTLRCPCYSVIIHLSTDYKTRTKIKC